MNKTLKIFHESWYQIANQKIFLRASVSIKRQFFRGIQWYVLHDPFTNQFYRLPHNAYEFIARLNKNHTVEQIWLELLETMPDKAPGQGEIIDLLAQLYHANLLHYDLAPDSTRLFERYKKRKQNIVKMNILNVMFARIPLFDPNNLLKLIHPFIQLLISPLGMALWITVLGIGIKLVIDNFKSLQVQSDGILSPSNLFLLYIAIAIVKVIHELGHAFAVRRYGGEVHTIGIMLMLLTPLPYTDATASLSFRNKWQRILVGAAGMIFELFIAAIAVMVWAGTGEGILHSLAYNMIFTASITTLLFNINPLMRYDGYYILCDLLEMPNLQNQSNQQLTYVLEKFAFGKKDCTSPSTSIGEAWFLALFSISSFIYRIVVFTGILLAVSNKLLLLAVIMAIFIILSWAVFPLIKFVKYISNNPGLARVRGRAIRVSLATITVIFIILNYIPFPYSFKAPGVLKAIGYMVIVNHATGQVVSFEKSSGSFVKRGDTLLVLENTELRNLLSMNKAALLEAELEYNKALTNLQADMEPLEKRISAFTSRLQYVEKEIACLVVRAEIDGIWEIPDANGFMGRWLPRGTQIGQIINQNQFYFASVIPQKEISGLFSQKIEAAQVKLIGQSQRLLGVKKINIIPMEQNQLPSSALGFSGGGDIAVAPGDSSGRKTVEPFYEVRAVLQNTQEVMQKHGRSGKIRFSLGYKPLLWQGWRKVLQLLQKHYQI